MRLTEGSVRIGGSVAYGAQQAWIMNATVKENILLGQPYNEARYAKLALVFLLQKGLILISLLW